MRKEWKQTIALFFFSLTIRYKLLLFAAFSILLLFISTPLILKKLEQHSLKKEQLLIYSHYHRSIMLLFEEVVEYQEILTAMASGDLSLHDALNYIQETVEKNLNLLSGEHRLLMSYFHPDTSFQQALLDWNQKALSPTSIREQWSEITRKGEKLSKEEIITITSELFQELYSLRFHVAQGIIHLEDFNPVNDYLGRSLFQLLPELQNLLLISSYRCEKRVEEGAETPEDRGELSSMISMMNDHLEKINDSTIKAFTLRASLAADVQLQASLEQELSRFSQTILSYTKELTEWNSLNGSSLELADFRANVHRTLKSFFDFFQLTAIQMEKLFNGEYDDAILQRRWQSMTLFTFLFLLLVPLYLFLYSHQKRLNHLAKGCNENEAILLTSMGERTKSDELAILVHRIERDHQKLLHMKKGVQEQELHNHQLKEEVERLTRSHASTLTREQQRSSELLQLLQEIEKAVRTCQGTSSQTHEMSKELHEISHEERRSIAEFGKSLRRLDESLCYIETKISSIETIIEAIKEVIVVITNIADRTNLLFLNAAIESHKLGHSGRSFGVIARDIRRLASKAAESTLTITALNQRLSETLFSSLEQIQHSKEQLTLYLGENSSLEQSIQTIDEMIQKTITLTATLDKQMEEPPLSSIDSTVREIETVFNRP